MLAPSPMELVICLIPAVIVLVLVIMVINAIRRKPARTTETNPQAIAKQDTAERIQSDQPAQGREGLDSTSNEIKISTEATVNSKNGLATTSLVLGILAIVIHILFGPVWSNCMGPLAIITGAISLTQIIKQGGKGKGVAITGIVLGTLPFIITLGASLLILLFPLEK